MWILSGYVLLSCALLSGCFVVAGKASRSAGWLTAALLTSICAKTVLAWRPDWEWWLFPDPGYALVQPLLMYPLAAAFFGVAASRLPVRWNRCVVIAVALGVVAYGAQSNAWIAWPEQHGGERYADARHHLQQSTHYTCGPTACVAALSHCGIRISEREMARLCLTRSNGSRLFDLYRGLVLAIGDRPFEVSIRDLDPAQVARAGMITVSSNRGRGHAVCLVGMGDYALVHDPLDREPELWTPARLRHDYRSPAIVIEPGAAACFAQPSSR